MKKSIIKATGIAIPERLVTNEDLTQWMDTSDEWIKQRTGIEQRYWIPEGSEIGASDLGLDASTIALERAGWQPEDIDMIIFATLSPDYQFPGPGCLLQHKLGLETTPALDIRQQCTGFLYGLATADSYIKSGLANKILFVGAEVHSTGLDISTRGRDVAVIFGDGAGAICIEGVEDESDKPGGVLGVALHAQGSQYKNLMLEAPSSKIQGRINKEMMKDARHYPVMNGSVIFKQALRRLPQVTKEILEKTNLTIDDIDLIIPHQANLRINQFYQEMLKIPSEKVFNNIQHYGNTTAASIPIAFDEAIEKKLIGKTGDIVFFTGFGAGLTWGGIIYQFD
ncbi:MAG: 3-oxoacyl-ACP synthase [Desulfobacteraceae bacterium 4572_19]|nr:MAG: 3-oxoacyl-ACP synthase [Desulfobacteraceae bacterium 4572_19]